MNTTYTSELLFNGFILIRSRRSGLVGLFTRDGRPHGGDLSTILSPAAVRPLILAAVAKWDAEVNS